MTRCSKAFREDLLTGTKQKMHLLLMAGNVGSVTIVDEEKEDCANRKPNHLPGTYRHG